MLSFRSLVRECLIAILFLAAAPAPADWPVYRADNNRAADLRVGITLRIRANGACPGRSEQI